MTLREFQQRIEMTYGARDRARGLDATFGWLVEEVGELARALREGDRARIEAEIGDVLAWAVTVASLCGVDATRAAARYAAGCPKCGASPCTCGADPPPASARSG
ncbi:MAG: MazG nucleotide pyrophosphohydrolase domain-containing protein [Armatimonadota bacterium]|nr:MazG nucleotide pyrophosphohydrolase domain-containing protein [Armatimonadota bacterium]MDR7518922.1 MazG nucleotide pyrophosphohydrolase domain-containing protein [Armatimonadota bacterium]MDR7550634.1 MazG nucleotide pyrophosphohydrolase domain-containing protein [Armatimonadota bacterium]